MTTETFTPCDPDTGEVLDADLAAELAASAAAEWRRVTAAASEAQDEARRLTEQADSLRVTLLALVPIGVALPVDGGTIVIAPPARRTARRVQQHVAEKYAEQIESIGIGKWSPPRFTVTVAEVNQHAPRLISLDVPLDELVPDPGLGEPRIEFVEGAR